MEPLWKFKSGDVGTLEYIDSFAKVARIANHGLGTMGASSFGSFQQPNEGRRGHVDGQTGTYTTAERGGLNFKGLSLGLWSEGKRRDGIAYVREFRTSNGSVWHSACLSIDCDLDTARGSPDARYLQPFLRTFPAKRVLNLSNKY